jgi:hypothetical protein
VRWSFGASLLSLIVHGEKILDRGAIRLALAGLGAKGVKTPAVFATQPNDLIWVDIAALNNGGLQLLDPDLHGGYLLDQRLLRLTETPEFGTIGVLENRCLVPFNSFAEYAPEPNRETKKKDVVWFALNDDRPLFAFAGVWTEFRGDRGAKSRPDPRPSPSLRIPDDLAERGG